MRKGRRHPPTAFGRAPCIFEPPSQIHIDRFTSTCRVCMDMTRQHGSIWLCSPFVLRSQSNLQNTGPEWSTVCPSTHAIIRSTPSSIAVRCVASTLGPTVPLNLPLTVDCRHPGSLLRCDSAALIPSRLVRMLPSMVCPQRRQVGGKPACPMITDRQSRGRCRGCPEPTYNQL